MKNLKKEAYKIRMTPEEKADMKARIFGAPAHFAPQPSPYFVFNFQFVTKAVALCLVLLLVGGGGVAYAAQGTLPGDALYPVKVDVTEPIQAALAVTPEAQADVRVALAQRRVEEAEALASQGKLDATTTAQLEDNFNTQTTSASDLALEVGHNDPAAAVEIEAKIASSLSVHGAILATLAQKGSDGSRQDGSAFATRVLARAQAAGGGSNSGEGKVVATAQPATNVRTFAAAAPAATTSASTSASTSVSGTGSSSQEQNQTNGDQSQSKEKQSSELQNRAQQAIDDAQKSYDNEKGSLDATTSAALDAQFSAASQDMSDGAYAKALSLALKLQAILSVQQKYRGDITPLLNVQLNFGRDGGDRGDH